MSETMSETKSELSQRLREMVDAFVSEGGEIIQVPSGVTGSGFRFNGLKNGPPRSQRNQRSERKVQLFGLSRHSKTRSGFHREKIFLNEKN